jgi:hypothetical protein
MKKKPKKVEYFTFLEDREFKESEWMKKYKDKTLKPNKKGVKKNEETY